MIKIYSTVFFLLELCHLFVLSISFVFVIYREYFQVMSACNATAILKNKKNKNKNLTCLLHFGQKKNGEIVLFFPVWKKQWCHVYSWSWVLLNLFVRLYDNINHVKIVSSSFKFSSLILTYFYCYYFSFIKLITNQHIFKLMFPYYKYQPQIKMYTWRHNWWRSHVNYKHLFH